MRRPRRLRRHAPDPSSTRDDRATGDTPREGIEPTVDMAPDADDRRSAAELRAALLLAEAQAEQYQGQRQRAAADLRNFRVRADEQQRLAQQRASDELIGGLLEVLDDFERTISAAPAEGPRTGAGNSWAAGVRLVERKLRQLLQAEGLSPIRAVGRQFDPHLHEAVTHEESAEYPDNEVIAELRRGYMLHDRVLRPTLVRVANNPAARATSTSDEGADTNHG